MEKNVEAESQNNHQSGAKIKHDWYQTDTQVVVIVLAKNSINVKVDNTEKELTVSGSLPDGNEYSLNFHLWQSVVPNQCQFKVLASKVEIKLKKQEGCRWSCLEKTESAEQNVAATAENSTQPPKYPSSSRKATDWNKVVKDIEKEAEENPQGEAAVNALFQNIYGQGSDEVRRAMNKSFVESGGTVLSTNWNEVGRRKVERKPADGVEWRSWN